MAKGKKLLSSNSMSLPLTMKDLMIPFFQPDNERNDQHHKSVFVVVSKTWPRRICDTPDDVSCDVSARLPDVRIWSVSVYPHIVHEITSKICFKTLWQESTGLFTIFRFD